MSGKLYWRIKKDGKWTWKPAKYKILEDYIIVVDVDDWKEEEE